jgi:hypothetical protein
LAFSCARSKRFATGVALLATLALAPMARAASSGGSSYTVTASAAAASHAPELKQGSTGKWVRTLQSDLTFVGYQTMVSGMFGSTTAKNVIAFKRAHGLSGNAIVGVSGWTALFDAVQQVESTPTTKARINPDGTVTAPSNAPSVIKAVIAGANRIAFKPYRYGGGHGKWNDTAYDCSGSVSYALHAGGLLSTAMPSGSFETWGSRGMGRWITLYTNAGHIYMKVAGLFFDTAAQGSNHGDRWSIRNISGTSGFIVRHPTGL